MAMKHLVRIERKEDVANILQAALADFVSLSLQAKQAHWNVVGDRFRSVHLQLDEVVDALRIASDDVAERMSAIGVPPQGNANQIATLSKLEAYPDGFVDPGKTITLISERLQVCVSNARQNLPSLGELDAVSEDLIIGILGSLEKQLWMLTAQE